MNDAVLIVAIVGLSVLGVGVLVEHANINLLYYIAGIIGAIAGIPIVIPKIGAMIQHNKEKQNVASKKE